MIKHSLYRASATLSAAPLRTKTTKSTGKRVYKYRPGAQRPEFPEFSERERVPRADSSTDDMNIFRFTKHKETLAPRRYSVDVKELDNAVLPEDIDPSSERYVSKLVLSVKGSCYSTIRSYFVFAHFAAECLEINVTKEPGKLVTGVYTINRSPFVHGAHKDRFKRDIWNRKLILHDISGTTADVYLSYVERNLPAGLTMAVTEERLTDINLDFLDTFYHETNSKLLKEIGGEDFNKRRSVVPNVHVEVEQEAD